MKKILLETSFSKIYMIIMIIITLLILGSYFSYAMFTVSKERDNAISIVTGNLTYKLEVDGEETNTLTVESNSVKDFTITLSNPNNRIARFNFYYVGDLDSYIKVGYISEGGTNTLPDEAGINLEKVNTTGSSNTYIIRVINNSSNGTTITLGVGVGLDYNDLSLPDNGHLFEEITYKGEVGEVVLDDISEDSLHDDGEDTFITGQYPNNYIWYSGKLWRAVSVNNEEKTVKLVTQWNISAINYSSSSTSFENSYMEDWLNDTTVDGFLGNLREPEKFIKMDSKWNASMINNGSKPPSESEGGTIVEASVGLLNLYEYTMSYSGTTYSNGYLNNGLIWWTATPYSTSSMNCVVDYGYTINYDSTNAFGIRPSINLKSSIKIVDGDGTEEDPYRLEGDSDTNLSGTLLNTRYSGEYITFGARENNLYRIVSHETSGLTKITSAESLKNSGNFISGIFGNNINFSSANTIGTFLNGEYLTNYIDNSYSEMIEDSSTWYLGTVGSGTSYKLAKYTDTDMSSLTSSTTESKVGLLRLGELMTGQFNKYENNPSYWTLTPYNSSFVRSISKGCGGLSGDNNPTDIHGTRPSLNLKSNVVITSGDGTRENPFQIELSN